MKQLAKSRLIHSLMISMLFVISLGAGHAQAKMIPTTDLIHSGGAQYSQQQLQAALASDELKQQLADLGVDSEQLSDRISSLTPDEIQQLNAELEQQPAGGIIGVLLVIFIVFVVTDMLCATDLFTFVRCIN
ncbi:PA2779 family protein [Aestuariirhabdus litorea]|uniref:PA2779 family protein n=1 Tax=Aestuariirhabdus litorea TaxID=2528527 RepID=A0A3P3VNT3_9GAMM|nr:PA2779 family protein [Aestuariirhabdus litorea]RRJ84007.1 hypothetical protein D0544_02485 [Aestuariirhabdus litorea]RWW97227.1 hypothetical protein DZC74_02480 [Endozoicomonadaceae bacterium GTF-13]